MVYDCDVACSCSLGFGLFVCVFDLFYLLISQASYFGIKHYIGFFVQIFHIKVIGKDKITNVFLRKLLILYN